MSLDICVSNTSKREVMVRPVSCGRCHRVCLRRLSQCCPTCATNKDNILKYPKCQNKQQTIMRRLHHDNSTAKQLYMLWRSFWTWFGSQNQRVSDHSHLKHCKAEQTHTNKVMDQRLSQSTLRIPRMVP